MSHTSCTTATQYFSLPHDSSTHNKSPIVLRVVTTTSAAPSSPPPAQNQQQADQLEQRSTTTTSIIVQYRLSTVAQQEPQEQQWITCSPFLLDELNRMNTRGAQLQLEQMSISQNGDEDNVSQGMNGEEELQEQQVNKKRKRAQSGNGDDSNDNDDDDVIETTEEQGGDMHSEDVDEEMETMTMQMQEQEQRQVLSFEHLSIDLIKFIFQFVPYHNFEIYDISYKTLLFKRKKQQQQRQQGTAAVDANELSREDIGIMRPNLILGRGCDRVDTLLMVAPWIVRLKVDKTRLQLTSDQMKQLLCCFRYSLQSVSRSEIITSLWRQLSSTFPSLVHEYKLSMNYLDDSASGTTFSDCNDDDVDATKEKDEVDKDFKLKRYEMTMTDSTMRRKSVAIMSRYSHIRHLSFNVMHNQLYMSVFEEMSRLLPHLTALTLGIEECHNNSRIVNTCVSHVLKHVKTLKSLTLAIHNSISVDQLDMKDLIGNETLTSLSLRVRQSNTIHGLTPSIVQCINQSRIKTLTCCIDDDNSLSLLSRNTRLERLQIETRNANMFHHVLPMKSLHHLIITPSSHWPWRSLQALTNNELMSKTRVNRFSLFEPEVHCLSLQNVADVLKGLLPEKVPYTFDMISHSVYDEARTA